MSNDLPILELTREMAIRPRVKDYQHANALLEHLCGCRCSTCKLVADMRRAIRDREGVP